MSDVSKRLEKADKYLQKGKMNDALSELLAAAEDEPDNPIVLERAADLCISQNKNKEAARLLSNLFDNLAGIGDQPKAVVTYKKLGRVGEPTVGQSFRYAQFIEKNNKKEAQELYQEAAKSFMKTGQRSDALAAYKRLVTLDPSLENYKSAGELANQLGDGKTAAEAFYHAGELERQANRDGHSFFERAFNLDAQNADVGLAYAQSLLQRGDGAAALRVIEPWAKKPEALDAVVEAYGRALMALKRPADAASIVLGLYKKNPEQVDEIALLVGTLLDVQEYDKALQLAKQTSEIEEKAGRHREYVGLLKDVTEKHKPDAQFLEYMVELYNSSNREHDYCEALLKLFELYYAAGNFLKAGDSLDAAAEVDPYEPGHQKRLEMLKGHIDGNRYRSISNRFAAVVQAGQPATEEGPAPAENEPTVLEDFMLQAEIFLQYSMRSKAVERLERIQKLFPREEERNEKLRSLYMSAGLIPKYETPAKPVAAPAASPVPAAPAPAAGAKPPTVTMTQTPVGGTSVPSAVANENAGENIARVTEITRNIYGQANFKAVLFTAVNDVGRHWNGSRCVAGLCTPGKPPSAALEY